MAPSARPNCALMAKYSALEHTGALQPMVRLRLPPGLCVPRFHGARYPRACHCKKRHQSPPMGPESHPASAACAVLRSLDEAASLQPISQSPSPCQRRSECILRALRNFFCSPGSQLLQKSGRPAAAVAPQEPGPHRSLREGARTRDFLVHELLQVRAALAGHACAEWFSSGACSLNH